MIFIDSNIPMYVIGVEHQHKAEALVLLDRLIAQDERLVTDAEVFQEILHRYAAINRRKAIGPAFEVLLSLVDEVFPVEKEDVLRAGEIVRGRSSIGARDALHLAVMERRGVRSILSFDADFDRWPGLQRLHRI